MQLVKFNFLFRIIALLQERLSPRQFLFLAAVLIGVSMGMAAVVLKMFVHYVYFIATFDKGLNFNYYYLFLPLLGILCTVLVVKYMFKGKLRKGMSFVHECINDSSGIIPRKHMYGHIITSSITVGMGGSVGLEAPIAVTGSAFGSNFAQRYKLSHKDRILLIACGAAAGVAAAFNAPIAGVLFALEVLLLDIGVSAFIPLIIAAASGALISNIILGEDILLHFKNVESFQYKTLPFFILLGIFTGLVSVYHARTFRRVAAFFEKKDWNIWQKAMVGGLALAFIIFIFPSLFGEGYESVKMLADNDAKDIISGSIIEGLVKNKYLILLFVGFVMLFKAFATGITVNSGGSGGNFAPSLFVGAYAGYFVANFFNLLPYNWFKLPVGNFTLVGMAGVLAGIYHAPLTAIFLIAEITGGYELMIPLMVVASISYAISHYFEPHSMEVKELVDSGKDITADRDTKILSSIKVYSIMETNMPIISNDATLDDLIVSITKTKRNIFPVISQNNKLEGIILLDSIRGIIFDPNRNGQMSVREIMSQPPTTVSSLDNLNEVMKKFELSGVWNLPVVDKGMYKGFVSKAAIINSYREQLKDSSYNY
ncbi:MAG TPA: chloride channel protein [Bacteroidia bacterium]